MDSVTTSLISGAAGGLAGKIGELGIKWIGDYFGSHGKEAMKKAEINYENFVMRLAKRVDQLESDLPPKEKLKFEEALKSPDTTYLIRSACISASITDNDDRHSILSELISQRMLAGTDDLIALVGQSASDIVNHLSSKHIRILGLLATLHYVKPELPGVLSQLDLEQDIIPSFWSRLELFIKDINYNENDLLHLDAVSSIKFNPQLHSDLIEILSLSDMNLGFKVNSKIFENFSWWEKLKELWEKGYGGIQLTTIGILIGVLYHDSLIGEKTNLNWD